MTISFQAFARATGLKTDRATVIHGAWPCRPSLANYGPSDPCRDSVPDAKRRAWDNPEPAPMLGSQLTVDRSPS